MLEDARSGRICGILVTAALLSVGSTVVGSPGARPVSPCTELQ
jgi:hypothetical protein